MSTSQGNSQQINLKGNLIGDYFTVTDKNDQNVVVGLAYFHELANPHHIQYSYGVNAFYLAKTTVSGTVLQEQLFTNLAFKYSVTHIPIYAMAKAEVALNNPFALVVDIGIGPNIMQTTDFRERALDGGITIPDYIFSDKTKAVFSATTGVGLKFNNVLRTHPLSCGYRLFYLGRGRLAAVNSQVGNPLKTGNSYANALICSVTL